MEGRSERAECVEGAVVPNTAGKVVSRSEDRNRFTARSKHISEQLRRKGEVRPLGHTCSCGASDACRSSIVEDLRAGCQVCDWCQL